MSGVPSHLVVGNDFMLVRSGLVSELKGDAIAALVWTRIHWRCDAESASTHLDSQGTRWWPVSREQLAEETGLDPNQVRRAIERLLAGGYIEATEHRLGGNYDRTKSYRPVVDGVGHERHPEGAQVPNESGGGAHTQMAQVPNAPTTDSDTNPRQHVGGAAVTPMGPWYSLCQMLVDAIVANGSKRPTITKAWLDAARLLVERDHRTPQQVANMIAWSQQHEFWRANILSMPKLREKYDQMRLQAERDGAGRDSAVVAAGRALFEQYRQREAAAAAKEREPEEWNDRRSLSS